ncbi:hypothetical protein JVT61DRAFT_9137 [Boletus reticuloceps]|uniref:Uncharacterized protein n=1 Tax=Boletus reticuloceps TaxID=495285 RepID=A0A8I2YHD8_9AGAM|nr:hypothetical protein JVT61DRAFT_9460 [Boletus reticuloceps]KAG6371782.1 hypothetical protein JVT61DRAFT_9137 [Boletus reticuloceps]
MSQTVSRHVSPSSTLSGCSSSSEAASSPIPQSSPTTDSACGRIDTTPPINTSIIFPLDSLPNLSLDAARVTSDVGNLLSRIRSFCAACYFLRELRPILVIEMIPNRRRLEWEDYHQGDAERCPWRLLHPSTCYDDFRRQVCSAICLRHPLESEWTICALCDDFYKCRADHERSSHGPSLLMVAFLIWEDVATCDHVFSFLQGHTPIPVPDFRSRSDYAVWLGSSACAPWSSLLYLHILVTVYHALRKSGLLPLYVFLFYFLHYSHQSHRPSQPDVEDVVIYKTIALP